MNEKAYEKKMPLKNYFNLKLYSVIPETRHVIEECLEEIMEGRENDISEFDRTADDKKD